MSEAPLFWFRKPGLSAWALWPAGAIYGAITARRMSAPPRYVSKLPVLCVGNFIVGGAGKTPTVIELAKIARDLGFNPGFLSRGFGGGITVPTLVDIKTHNARDVGDEPLILGRYGTTVISVDRPAGAKLLEEQGVDIILMDDGFQNPSLHKDYTLAVVDARRGVGNGFPIPAGPLRAPLQPQMARASAMLLIGKSGAGTEVVRTAAKMAKPILEGQMTVRQADEFDGQRVLAFAGIADPTKFYRSLEACGAEIVERRSFHDHHPFSDDECVDIMRQSRASGLMIVTTEKDAVRLIRMGVDQQELRAASKILHMDLGFDNVKLVERILRDTVKQAQEHRLKLSA